VIETRGARKAREEAEWEKLSFVERSIKKYIPSYVNKIAILVNNYFAILFLKKFIYIRLVLGSFMSFMSR
jgi:hypothetical protein